MPTETLEPPEGWRVDTVRSRADGRYLPGPRSWGRRLSADGRRISGITQPPLAATCMRLLFDDHPDERRARPLLRVFHAWHRFLLTERDPRGFGEPVLIHPRDFAWTAALCLRELRPT